MATIILSAVGAAAGASLGGGVLGIGSAVIGRAVGATLGRVVDQSIMGAGSDPVETGRVDRFRLTGAGAGAAIPRIHGRMRVGAQVIWASNFVEHVNTTGGGGKGAPAQPQMREFSYTVSLALGLCEGVIGHVGRVWADGREIDPGTLDMRIYDGRASQQPDPVIEAVEGAGRVPAYRGLAYVVIESLDLSPYGGRVPQFTFEVVRPEARDADVPAADLSGLVRAVAMIPGTGEYALATTPVRLRGPEGEEAYVNRNTVQGRTDFEVSLDTLTGELPRCGSTSLVVSWFGDDLRCGRCTLRPKVEHHEAEGVEMPWTAGGIDRGAARIVPEVDGHVVYGGTPADASVIEALRALRAAGQEVMFYPFVLMDQLAGNGLPDPYGDAGSQPPLPWRGRITLDVAPGRAGSADGTEAAETEVDAFFGRAGREDFTWSGGRLRYGGPDDWGYRRFILHYAHLCAAAGGVDAFCVGSELRGLTWIRGANGFPAVDALIALAADVRSILGPDTRISYAADWSEYRGYAPSDGSGDLYFHLDPLWADANIDFIGIDNYMPLTDWRGEEGEADAAYGAIHDLGYLKDGIMGGEGYDWYYASPEDRAAQKRTPITDGAHGEPWVHRVKDLLSWWRLAHHDRVGGRRRDTPTAWVPGSKPIWFTELGCAAIDKGTNQPNKFLDPKSSESALPHFSTGARDDFVQLQYLRAMTEFWADPANNPPAQLYDGTMVDMSRAHVWAWDARPYPAFPGLPQVWSDADNYDRGHWLNGRSGSRALASVVREICAEAGVTALDLSRLHGVARGYAVPQISDARAALQPLMLAYGFDAVERDGVLVFRTRDGRSDGTVDPDRVVVVAGSEGDIARVRTPEAERVGRLKLSFVGADGDFETATAEAVFPDARSQAVSQSELPLLLSRAEGRAIAERWLAEARVARDRVRLALPPSRMGLGAGDTIEIDAGRYRIDHVEQGAHQVIDAVRVEPSIYDAAPAAGDGMRVTRHTAPVPPTLVFLDLPALGEDRVPHAPYAAAAARPWPGSVTVLSSHQDAGFAHDTTLPAPATMGVTLTPLARAGSGRPDRGPALRVRLMGGTLESVGQGALLTRANAMAIGSGEDDLWEVFQFRDAALVAPRTYDLFHRLRGQLGTDAIVPPVWPEGSRVVLLDARLRQIDLSAEARGLDRVYRYGPSSQVPGDVAWNTVTRAFEGVGLRPLSPVHLGLAIEGADHALSWIRRTRVGGDSWAGLDVPLGEERESYLLRVFRDGVPVRTEVLDTPRWRYGPQARDADGTTQGYRVEVAQVGAGYGPGPAAGLSWSA